MDGYAILRRQALIRQWTMVSVILVSIGIVLTVVLGEPMITADVSTMYPRFEKVHELKSTDVVNTSEYSKKNKLRARTAQSFIVDSVYDNNRMNVRFYFPEDSMHLVSDLPIEVLQRKKHYLQLGDSIQFIEGYMMLRRDYVVWRNMEVPHLGGVPANIENRNSNIVLDTAGYRSISRQGEVEQLIEHYADSSYASAISSGQKLLRDFPTDVNIHFYMAMSYYQLGKYEDALHHYLYSVTPNELLFDEDQDYYVAECYQRLGRASEAEEAFDLIIHSNSYYKTRAATRYRMFAR
jgi:tetratricopeptide (TPR) repeat protein